MTFLNKKGDMFKPKHLIKLFKNSYSVARRGERDVVLPLGHHHKREGEESKK